MSIAIVTQGYTVTRAPRTPQDVRNGTRFVYSGFDGAPELTAYMAGGPWLMADGWLLEAAMNDIRRNDGLFGPRGWRAMDRHLHVTYSISPRDEP